MEEILDVVFLRNKKINFIKSDTCIGSVFRSNNYWEIWMLDYFAKYYMFSFISIFYYIIIYFHSIYE